MKKLLVVILACIVFGCFTSPAFALFTNGGFETGDFSGWTLSGTGAGLSAVISAATPMQPGQTLDVDPYNGNYMARINDIYGGRHWTSISQQAALAAPDLTETLYVNWGAMLVDPHHPVGAQPYFDIAVYRNAAILDSFHADATNLQGGGWVNAGNYGGTLWYKAGTYSYPLNSFAVSDIIDIEMTVHDCGYGAHGGFAFLDGIGTVYQPPGGPIPEPATMLLLGSGLIGLAGYGRKKFFKS